MTLQDRDYFGDFEDATAQSCGSWVANSYTYYGRWVSCTALGHGVYRTKGTGVVEPDEDLPETANGYSTSTTLC